MNVGFISLGCSKNRVDTEIMIAIMKNSGYKIVNKLDRAEIIIINTCGFIDDAKEEAINTIIETGKMKTAGFLRYLVATGCLAQRYGQELLDEMPELDGIVGISFFTEIDQVISRIQQGERVALSGKPPAVFIEKGTRILTTPPGSAYLKITEGCNNRCSYCAIPLIRGNLRSRPQPEIVREARELADRGVRELVLVGQDTAVYGSDLDEPFDLPSLLAEMNKIVGLEWIRLMYLHPAHINERIIDAIAADNKVLPYLDIPIQHSADRVLKNMNRKHDYQHLDSLIQRLRERIDRLVLRTTVMLGFPGETETDYQCLYDFVKTTRFDWLGAFAFRLEEGTPAYTMPGAVPEAVKAERLAAIMRLQQGITRRKNMDRLNAREPVLISSQASKNLYIGRAYFQAPEVDGITMVKTGAKLVKGSLVEVQLKAIRDYDMIGELVDEYSE
ncbi:MAG: 30S ribosomal protein S12 methylthiotransferase RimO [Syntrophomonadaceae bacterium]|nr:30S ribosomal protein S12 methylthiotransferase RimO [Syntrophomonadaceae bacterium]